ncbi:MAG TPA: SMI1/KNR4 family protein [Chitinophagaceae bacterium]|nr:SMI1/KNR4 family protein [Chitinophagaceae bacterium]
MKINELIAAISQKHNKEGIDVFPPASIKDIQTFEKQIVFSLPEDFKEFYLICNGFGCAEDIFNMIPLNEIRTGPDNCGDNWFYFAEYMIYSDMWGLRMVAKDQYEIFNGSHPSLVLTSSLNEFLERFLLGNVFDHGGLYEWRDEIEIEVGRSKLNNNKQ